MKTLKLVLLLLQAEAVKGKQEYVKEHHGIREGSTEIPGRIKLQKSLVF